MKILENMNSEMNSPTQFKGRLNELLSQIRLHKSSNDNRTMRYSVENSAISQIKEFLSVQQESLKFLIETSKSDFEQLKIIMSQKLSQM